MAFKPSYLAFSGLSSFILESRVYEVHEERFQKAPHAATESAASSSERGIAELVELLDGFGSIVGDDGYGFFWG
jgi:hypothetical protein